MMPTHNKNIMDRNKLLKKLKERSTPWDMVIIGGGATGIGIALDAASRGYAVCCIEQYDFGKGTSSRSTKLVHGGVRYLEQGNVMLVMESLHERGIMRQNAPHLVRDLPFIVPNYNWWGNLFYGIGLKLYDMLARKYSFGSSKILSKDETLSHISTLKSDGLRGGVLYHDGQFDDARLLVNLARTAVDQGAVTLNYVQATGLKKNNEGVINGVTCIDTLTDQEHTIEARCVINATGAFSDVIRKMDDPSVGNMIIPSQGVHLVVSRDFLPGTHAIMVPHTSDGRVLFAIPWHKHTVIGTTDTPLDDVVVDPIPLEEEIDFILENAAPFLEKSPTRKDVTSAFAGIRPLVGKKSGSTASISRDFTVTIDDSGLVSVAGGKWTTYRKMAEKCVTQAAENAGLTKQACITKDLAIHGYHKNPKQFGDLEYYGTDAELIQELSKNEKLGATLHDELLITEAEIVWAVRFEMAQSIEDVLARRTRVLFMNAKAAIEIAPKVAKIIAKELGKDEAWQQQQIDAFGNIAAGFIVHQ